MANTFNILDQPLVEDYILIQDQKAAGVDGGTFTSGAYQTRDINTIVTDTGNNASLSSNQIVLLPGTYRLKAYSAAFRVDAHQLRLQNITLTSTINIGHSLVANQVDAGYSTAILFSRFIILTTTNIELQHRCSNTRASDGFGNANATFPDISIFTSIDLFKEL